MKENKFKKTLALVIEPIALGLLALLFIIPTITVVNLQPLTKKLKEINVLGVNSSEELKINIVGGTHQVFFSEKLASEEGRYLYSTKLTKREADSYSKPILEIINTTGENKEIEIYGGTHLPTKSDIGLIINDQKYRLQEPNGDILRQSISLVPNEKYLIYLYIESFSDVQFEEDFELTILELE